MRYYLIGFALLLTLAENLPAQTRSIITLDEAQRLSAEHSYAIKAAHSDSLAAIADMRAAQASRLPTASLNAVSFYIDELQTLDLPFGALEAGSHDNYQADLRLNLPLYTGGRISSQVKIQKAQAWARGYGLTAKRFENAYITRRAYLSLLTAQALGKASVASLERVRLIRQDVQNLYSSGLADSSDILDAELAHEKAIRANDERAVSAANAGANLARLLGLPSDAEILLTDSIPLPGISAYGNQAPPEIERPEISAQEARVNAANSAISLTRAAYFPRLNGYGGYSVGKPNRNFLDNVWNDYWTAGLNLTWEFNLGGQSLRNVFSARQAAKSAQSALAEIKESLALQAGVALENLKLSYRSFEIASREFDIAGRQYRFGLEKQRAGGMSVNRLLELEADLTSLEQLYRVSLINFYISETEYLYAIGSPRIFGGF